MVLLPLSTDVKPLAYNDALIQENCYITVSPWQVISTSHLPLTVISLTYQAHFYWTKPFVWQIFCHKAKISSFILTKKVFWRNSWLYFEICSLMWQNILLFFFFFLKENIFCLINFLHQAKHSTFVSKNICPIKHFQILKNTMKITFKKVWDPSNFQMSWNSHTHC